MWCCFHSKVATASSSTWKILILSEGPKTVTRQVLISWVGRLQEKGKEIIAKARGGLYRYIRHHKTVQDCNGAIMMLMFYDVFGCLIVMFDDVCVIFHCNCNAYDVQWCFMMIYDCGWWKKSDDHHIYENLWVSWGILPCTRWGWQFIPLLTMYNVSHSVQFIPLVYPSIYSY